MLIHIATVATFLYFCNAEENNETDIANRYNFNFYQPPSSQNCYSQGGRGVCMPLSNCPALRDSSRYKDPRNLFHTSYNSPCPNNGPSFVCCPITSQQLNQPRPPEWDRPTTRPQSWNLPTTSSWGRPNSGEQGWGRPETTTSTWGRPVTEDHSGYRPVTASSNWGGSYSGDQNWNRLTTNRPWDRPTTNRPWDRPTQSSWGKPDSGERLTKSEPWIRPTRPSRTRPPQEVTTSSGSTEKTGHRNRRLLPEDKCGLDIAQKILGGEETALEELPWMALLRLRFPSGRTVHMCGGSLINSRYVLTAAHCLKGGEIPSNAFIDQVRLGEHDMDKVLDCVQPRQCSPEPDDVDVEERIPHPKYNPKDSASLNDIALLRLKRPAKLSLYVQPICLPLDSLTRANYDNKKLLVAGWGRTANAPRSNSNVKLKVEIPVVPFGQCAPNYRSQKVNIQESSQMCAGGEPGKDSCQGDSGGPLMSLDTLGSEIRWHVTGIVSFGPQDCGEKNKPAIYTKVSQYVDWILDIMRE